MSIVGRNTLKNWFIKGAKPLASQFDTWIDSFWHKEDSIPANKVEGLQAAMDTKADKQVMDTLASGLAAHKVDTAAHGDIREAIGNEADARVSGDTGTLDAAKNYADGKFVPESAAHANGSTTIANAGANNGAAMTTTQNDANTLIQIKTHSEAGNPVMGGITGEFGDTDVGGSKRLLFARGADGEIYVYLRKNKAAPASSSDLSDDDLVLNKAEIITFINGAVSAIPEGLSIPNRVALESQLPDATEAANGAYYVVQSFDVTAPGRTGRVWKNSAMSDDWLIVLDEVYAPDSDWIVLNDDGALTFADDVKALINGALQSNQLITAEPTVESTDLQIVSARQIWHMFGGAALSTLKTTAKTIINAINELFEKFSATSGHVHNGTDSKRIAYSDLTGIPTINTPFAFVIDSDDALAAWANNTAGNDYTSVLIKAGTWTSNEEVNLGIAGTKVVMGMPGSLLSFTSLYGLRYDAVPTTSDYWMNGVNIEIKNGHDGFRFCINLTNCTSTGSINYNGSSIGFRSCKNLMNCIGNNTSHSGGGYGFYGCTNLTNCIGVGSSGPSAMGIGFSTCTNLINCTGTGTHTTTNNSYGFYNCRMMLFCKPGLASGTATYEMCYMHATGTGDPVADTATGGWNRS
jgi:hypothetical protein